jgi:cystathionine beta-lyase
MDFDTIIDRRGTGALKWRAPDVIPLWVADMDFAPPDAVVAALRRRMDHPIFGYTDPPPSFFETLRAWYASRYGAAVETEAFLLGPGAVPSMGIAVRTFAARGEGVLVMPPVYYPFMESVRGNGRVVVEAPLRWENGRFRFDPEAGDRAIREAASRGVKTRMLMFCSPHNPGGTVWTREELAALLEFARRHGLLLFSDEIHGDIALKPKSFVSLAGFPGAAERSVVISSPNKTFNLAGLHLSHFVVEDAALRAELKRGIGAAGYSQPNVLSLVAAQAAYEHGEAWLDALIEYLRANAEIAADFIGKRIPGMDASVPDGTYLIWADAAGLAAAKGCADDRELVARLEAEALVKLTPGGVFGRGGEGHVRINVACPRALLAEGLNRLAAWASDARPKR